MDRSQSLMAITIQRVPSGVLLMQPAMVNGKCWRRTRNVCVAPVNLEQEHMTMSLTAPGKNRKGHRGADGISRKMCTIELHFASRDVGP